MERVQLHLLPGPAVDPLLLVLVLSFHDPCVSSVFQSTPRGWSTWVGRTGLSTRGGLQCRSRRQSDVSRPTLLYPSVDASLGMSGRGRPSPGATAAATSGPSGTRITDGGAATSVSGGRIRSTSSKDPPSSSCFSHPCRPYLWTGLAGPEEGLGEKPRSHNPSRRKGTTEE